MGINIFRIVMVVFLGVAGYIYPPFTLKPAAGATAAVVLGLVVILIENRIRAANFRSLWSAATGSFLGILLGWVIGSIYQGAVNTAEMATFIRIFFLVVMPYAGFVVGTRKPEWFNPVSINRLFKEKEASLIVKILDTSSIIDGRIADLCDTGFIEGDLVVPQFVLKELQFIADSADSLKRQRGRRGLDVLDRLQKSGQVTVTISEMDFAHIKDVDSKLIEFAKTLGGKIITNDFNLNKVARIHGVLVLNINELAGALRPVALPGESMSVFILKEGKEKDQGVGYLEDGTMVVVDNSRRMIGQTVDVTVTSVLQTTMGKMIFGRFNGED